MSARHISPPWTIALIALIIVVFWAAAQISSCLPATEHIVVTAAGFVTAAYMIWRILRLGSGRLPARSKMLGCIGLALLIAALLLFGGRLSLGSSERGILLSIECIIVAWLVWYVSRRR